MFRIFRRKHPDVTDLKQLVQTETDKMRQLSQSDLTQMLDSEIDEYRKGISEKLTFGKFDYDELTLVASSRDEIHIIATICAEKGIAFNAVEIETLDAEWQKWCLQRIPIDFADRERYTPATKTDNKTEWWFWIDRLDELTPEERSTL